MTSFFRDKVGWGSLKEARKEVISGATACEMSLINF